MAIRQRIIQLQGLPLDRPSTITIDGAYWFLRLQLFGGLLEQWTIDGNLCTRMVTSGALGGNTACVAIDYPPLFDGRGRPITWNQVLEINPAGREVTGCIIIVYLDDSLPETP